MRNVNQPPAHLMPLRRSRLLAAWIVLTASCATILGLACLRLDVATLVSLCVLLGSWRAMVMHALRTHHDAIVAVAVDNGMVTVTTLTGQAVEGKLSAGGWVSAWLMVIRWTPSTQSRGPRVLVLLPDALSPSDARRIRTQVRWGRDARAGKV